MKSKTRHVSVKDKVARTMTVEDAINGDGPTVIEGDQIRLDACGNVFVEESLGDDEQGAPVFVKMYLD